MAKRQKKKLVLPNKGLLLPETPHDRRMRIPFPSSPQAESLAGQAMQRMMDTDIHFQLLLKKKQKRLPHVLNSRINGGSGMRMSELLREYFFEYYDRFHKYGPQSFPMSFNVVEAFMRFSKEDMLFDIRRENEHLLSLDDYFDWYVQQDIRLEPKLLIDFLEDGQIYSYEMACNRSGYRLAGKSQKIIAGVSIVRHENELSCMMLAGENPPLVEDGAIFDTIMKSSPVEGREAIELDPKRSIQDRYLKGLPGYAKAIVLTRFDLFAGKHDVRYVNLDDGPAFTVLTDDWASVKCLGETKASKLQANGIKQLERYESLFSALASLIFLPAFFASNICRVETTSITTLLGARSTEEGFRETIAELGGQNCHLSRDVRCMPNMPRRDELKRSIAPPVMDFKCDGYWIAIGPNELGKDKHGNKIFGQTWIAEDGVYSASGPMQFEVERPLANRQSLEIKLDNECKERALVGEVTMTVALAGHICREVTVSDKGIDMEVEFKDSETGEATGQKVYLQLKSGDSHLRRRKKDDKEIFRIAKERHVKYWIAQHFPVFLIVRDSAGDCRWMEIRSHLREISAASDLPIKHIVFVGRKFSSESVSSWIDF